ncbi:MAG TPA: hypothetical protein VEJ43_10165 [Pseudolabrys sp.]|nr:hypothetical protein [Pseudolabrys sp.]
MILRSIALVLGTVAVATVLATPASASKATEAYAMAPSKGVYSVIGWDGRVLGADPDRNIRFQLMRDGFANEN